MFHFKTNIYHGICKILFPFFFCPEQLLCADRKDAVGNWENDIL